MIIKRNIKTAKEIKEKVENIAEDIKEIGKIIVEDTYIVAYTSSLAMETEPNAKE